MALYLGPSLPPMRGLGTRAACWYGERWRHLGNSGY